MNHPCGAVCRTLPATAESVDSFCQELRSSVLAGIPERERFAVELLLREALMNAVTHGGKGDRSSGELSNGELSNQVRCSVERAPGRIGIRVSDSGGGFNWRGCEIPDEVPLTPSGHGLRILRLYASEIRFNAEGNELELTRTFREGEDNE